MLHREGEGGMEGWKGKEPGCSELTAERRLHGPVAFLHRHLRKRKSPCDRVPLRLATVRSDSSRAVSKTHSR